MSRQGGFVPSRAALLLSVLFLVHPCGILAQAGAGGGHAGGGLAGGGGLSGTGRPTGVDVKDDLKDYHALLAAQATKDQTIRYLAMLKSTDAASAELHSLLDADAQQSNAPDPTARASAIAKAIETAREEDKNFLDTFSEPQKSALREVARRLLKADAELEQQSRIFSAAFENAKQLVANVESLGSPLDAALASFRRGQMELGEEMNIETGDRGASESYDLVPARTTIKFGEQAITVTTSGVISQGKASADGSFFTVELDADLSEFQQNVVELLNSKLGSSDRCGNRIEILDATLGASDPVSLVDIRLHFERWICLPGGMMNEMAEGNGGIELKLSSSIADDGTPSVATEISRVDAEGLLGESLSGSLGDSIREDVNAILSSVVRYSTDFKNILPPAALGHTTFTRARFETTGLGRLILVLDGEVHLSSDAGKVLMWELHGQPAPVPAQSATTR